jgi:hypothetical protein
MAEYTAYTVYFGTGATSAVTVNVDIDPDMDRDEARQKNEHAAWQKLDTGLCYSCCRKVELGDWESDKFISNFDGEDE